MTVGGLLDDTKEIERLDPHGVRAVLAGFPAQCRDARRLRPAPEVRVAPPGLAVIAGMGGSAAGGDLLGACLADRLKVPVLTHRGYGLPAVAQPGALVVVSSYSGETAEAISAFERATEVGVSTVAITSGGRLGRAASQRGVPVVSLPAGLMPRMALGYLFFPLLAILEASGLPAVPADELEEAFRVLEVLGAEVGAERPAGTNEAKRVALSIGLRVPVVYGGQVTAGAAYRWKTDIEENAKRFAVAGALPEMNHNEVEGWRPPEAGRLQAIFLRDRGEHPEIGRRFETLGSMLAPLAGGISEVWSRGEGRLARLLSLVYLGQWTSYYLALLNGADPWPVPRLDEVKRRLRS